MGFTRQIKDNIRATKEDLARLRSFHPDDDETTEEEDELLDNLGMLIELLQQFEEG